MSRLKSAGSGKPDDSETPSGSGGSSGEGGGRRGGGGGDDPGDQRDHDKNDTSEDDNEEEEESDEDNDGEDDDEEFKTAVAEVLVGSLNPGSPSAKGNNWHSYEVLMTDTYPAKSKTLYLEAFSNFEQYFKREKKFVPNVVPPNLVF